MFGGYPYNPLTLTRVLGARMPGASPEMIDTAFFDERDEVPPYEHQPWHDSPTNEARLGESTAWAMSTDSLPNLDADKELARSLREQRPDLTVLTDAHCPLAPDRGVLIQQTFENAMIVSSLSALGTGALGAICEGLGDPTLVIRLLAESRSTRPCRRSDGELGREQARRPRSARRSTRGPTWYSSSSPQEATTCAGIPRAFEQFLRDHGSRARTNTTR